MQRHVVTVLAGLVLASTAMAESLPQMSIVSIPATSRLELNSVMHRVNLDVVDVARDHFTACVNAQEIDALKAARVPYTVVYADALDLIHEVRPATQGVGAYHTYDSVNAELAAWATALPDVAHVEKIGTSVEGRAINALVIQAPGAAPAAERPKMLVMGLHHAREWISVEVPMALIKKLLEGYQHGDADLKALLASRTLWFVPIVNPDGFEYSQKSYSMWRKNRHKTWSMPGVNGVDPNRNYGFEWTGSGSSSMAFSETYRGPAEWSEPEVQAIRGLAEREKFTATMSYHSYSELVLFPWGYTNSHCPDDAKFRKLGGEMAAINKYTPQTGADLYLVNGEADDYLYGKMGAWAYTIELARQFIPKDKDIPSIVTPNVEAALHFLKSGDHLAADPGIMLHLVERLAGAPGAAKGPWSPGVSDDASRRQSLDWAARELGHRLAALAATEGRAAIQPYLAELAQHAAGSLPELKAAARAALAAVPRE